MKPIATPLPALSGDFGKRLIRWCLKALPGLTANLASLAIFILVWKFSSDYLHNPLFPGPVIVAKTFLVLLRSGDLQGTTLLHHSYVSLYRVLLGFAAACVTAIPLGILLGLWKPLYTGTRAVSEPLRFTPPLAWIPFAIIFFSGLSRYIFLIWVGTFFPLFIMTMNIIGATPPLFVDVGKAAGGSRAFIIWRIVIPNALPQIAAAMRMTLGPAWMCVMAAEMVTAELVGLGQMIYNYATVLRMDVVIVGMITIGLLGFALNEIFLRVEQYVFRHRPKVRL